MWALIFVKSFPIVSAMACSTQALVPCFVLHNFENFRAAGKCSVAPMDQGPNYKNIL